MSKTHPPELKKFVDKEMDLKLNGNHRISGVLRGFDPFMNMVVDVSLFSFFLSEFSHSSQQLLNLFSFVPEISISRFRKDKISFQDAAEDQSKT